MFKIKKTIASKLTFTIIFIIAFIGIIYFTWFYINSLEKEHSLFKSRIEKEINIVALSIVDNIWSYDYSDVKRVLEFVYNGSDVVSIELKTENFSHSDTKKVKSSNSLIIIKKDIIVPKKITGDIDTNVGTLKIAYSDENRVQKNRNVFFRSLIGLIIIISVISISLKIVFNYFLKKPFDHFTYGFQEIAEGNYEYVISLENESNINDEFLPLRTSLSKMANDIKNQMSLRKIAEVDLKIAGEELEHKVIKRTNELSLANTELNKLLAETQRQQEELQDTNEELEERTYLIDKQNHELEKKAEDLKQSNHYKSAFLANMSHEIRTPMNSIIGFSEILKSRIDDKKNYGYLDTIHKNGIALLNLINSILDLSKIESGKLDINYTPLLLKNLVQELDTLFNEKISDKGLDFIIDIDSKLNRAILLDETRIRQVLINLIGNSIKFTNEGYIKLIITCLNCDNPNRSSFDIKISVIDTGIGLSEESIKSIFETFVQAKEQKKGEYGGTGLGLSITKSLLELMDGEISVSSKLGAGATFDIILKNVEVALLDEASLDSKEINEIENIKFKNDIILLVDDISYNRDLVKGFLEEHNLIFFEAENGKEAVSMVKEVKPNFILMDMKMPVMDGFEATKIIKKDEETKDIPVIALTASAMIEDEIEVNKICDSYLSKPVGKKELVLKLMEYLPYTQKGAIAEAAEISETTSLTLEKLKEYPEIVNIISKEKDRSSQILQGMNLNDIELFAREMNELGEKYRFAELSSWGQNLINAVDSFEIDIIETELKVIINILTEI